MGPISRLALTGTRGAIDGVDDAMVVLLAGRQRLAGMAGRLKRRTGQTQADPAREQAVQCRARHIAAHLGLSADSAERLMQLLIAEAHRRQRSDAAAHPSHSPSLLAAPMSPTPSPRTPSALLRLLPPPKRWRPWLARMPRSWQQGLVLRALSQALASPLALKTLQPISGRRLGIEVQDLDLRWVFELQEGRLRIVDAAAEATVSGSMTDLLLLASRLEDADTLFFQRRLTLTGDTELGLTVRNLLDRLPWEALPLGSRILLQRAGILARDARAVHRSHSVRNS